MKVTAQLNNLRIAPRKSRLVANLVKGLDVQDALNQLDSTVKGASAPVAKLIRSAIANGENNLGLDKDNLYIFNAIVEEGLKMKRWRPRAFGRAARILKRTSSVIVTLEERVEGKNRKSPEQIEKERKERMEKKIKAEREARKEQEEKEKEQDKKEKESGKIEKVEKTEVSSKTSKNKKADGKGFVGRIFRRKSM
jgi:large subunit ribosomal protein L22